MKPSLSFLGVHRVQNSGRYAAGPDRTVIRLCTPNDSLRDVELTAAQVLQIIGQCQQILTRMGPQLMLAEWEKPDERCTPS